MAIRRVTGAVSPSELIFADANALGATYDGSGTTIERGETFTLPAAGTTAVSNGALRLEALKGDCTITNNGNSTLTNASGVNGTIVMRSGASDFPAFVRNSSMGSMSTPAREDFTGSLTNSLGTFNGTVDGTISTNATFGAVSKSSYTGSDALANVYGTGSGVIRQVQANQHRSHVQNNNTSFDGTNSGTGMAVCIDNILAGSDILVTASFCWYISTGNVAYFTFYKRIDTGSGFNTEAQVSVDTANYGISGGLQNASSNPDGKTHIATITYLESNCSAGRYQFEVHRRCDSSSGFVGINGRGESNGEVGTATIWAMELT